MQGPGAGQEQEIGRKLDRQSWIGAARTALIQSGHAAVKVDRLATSLGVTRGSFYWHFKDRRDLLDALLADWQQANSAAFYAALSSPGTPTDRLRELGRVWLDESDYSPAYDSAMRDWARFSEPVGAAVRHVDDARIAALAALFEDEGYDGDEAFIRGRVTYFHQVGYYAMGVRETRETRERYRDLYMGVLMGRPGERKG